MSAEPPPEGRHHPGQLGRDALGSAPARPQKRRRRQWVDFARVLNLSSRFGDQGPGMALVAPPGAVLLVRTLLGDLDLTRRGSDTATPGRCGVCAPKRVTDAEPAKTPLQRMRGVTTCGMSPVRQPPSKRTTRSATLREFIPGTPHARCTPTVTATVEAGQHTSRPDLQWSALRFPMSD
jgi:hypothetical protein